MANVVRFALSEAIDLHVDGVGNFVDGVLDVDANNIAMVARARYLVQPYRAIEIGIVDEDDPKPTLPGPIVVPPPNQDPFPQYLTQAESDARYAKIVDAGGNAIVHGDDANVARPNVAGPVVWFGSVDPVNSDDTRDVWVPVSTDGTGIGGGGGGGGTTVTVAGAPASTLDVQPVTLADLTPLGVYVKPGGGIPESDLSTGVTTKLNAASSGSVLTADFGPADHGLIAWSADPVFSNTNQALAAGTPILTKVPIRGAVTITNIVASVTVAGATLTNSFAGIYNPSGVRLGVTADQSTAWTTVGTKVMPLTSPLAVSDVGFVWVALLVGTATTTPQFTKTGAGVAASQNLNLGAGNYRGGTLAGGQTTGLPASFTPSTGLFVSAIMLAGIT